MKKAELISCGVSLFLTLCLRVCAQGSSADASWAPGFETMFGGDIRYPNALAFDGEGNMYVGGQFQQLVVLNTSNIARWDGENWFALGSGLNGEVHALVANETDIYAAGSFTMAGEVAAARIARWDGSQWWPLSGGVDDGEARALAWMDGRLYVAGNFTSVDGAASPGLACWDGVSWSNLGGGVAGENARGNALLAHAGSLYLGGHFTSVGGVAATNVACWKGESWESLGEGYVFENDFPAEVLALAMNEQGHLFVGGGAPSYGAPLLARWNGSGWHHFNEIPFGNNMLISSLSYYKGSLYVANVGFVDEGEPGSGDNLVLDGLGRWDGTNWFRTQAPLRYGIRSMAQHQGNLFVSGKLQYMMAFDQQGITKFNGERWSVIGNGYSGRNIGAVNTLATSPYGLLAGGRFLPDIDYPSIADGVARWEGDVWSHLGDGILVTTSSGAAVQTLEVHGNRVYAGGIFHLWNLPTQTIMSWDGVNWNAMGSGLPGVVFAIASNDEKVYAGGDFGVRQWNGSEWNLVGQGIQGVVRVMEFMGEILVVGGDFLSLGEQPLNYIAGWNGTNWFPLGQGLDAPVLALCPLGPEELIVGGEFVQAGGIPANRVARWKDNSWSNLGDGFADGLPYYRGGGLAPPAVTSVKTLVRDPSGQLFAGGNFQTADGVPANFVAKWNGDVWQPLGSGVDHIVYSAAVADEGIYFGGDFYRAGGRLSVRIALWKEGNFSEIPALTIFNRNEQARLQWPSMADGFILEERIPSAPVDAWTQVTNAVEVVDDQNAVTVPVEQSGRFFRLRK